MLAVTFLIKVLSIKLLLFAVPESLTLLASGVGLVGATVVLRRVLKRRDEKIEGRD